MPRNVRSQFVFIDESDTLKRSVANGTRKALSHWGGYIRRTARNSMKRARKGQVSKPYEPPKRHTGALAKSIYYGWDKTTQTVVVGALRFAGSDVPRALEYGASGVRRVGALNRRAFRVGEFGPLQERYARDRKHWIKLKTDAQARRATRIANSGVKLAYTIAPRPYMRPALDTEQAKRIGAQAFKDVVK